MEPRTPRRPSALIREALAIEKESALEAGALGFMARIFVQATLPHRRQSGVEYTRSNGLLKLSILTPSHVGPIPYGRYPRLVLSWMTAEAMKTKSPRLVLGRSFNEFMRSIGVPTTGGKRGSIHRLRQQIVSLFGSMVSATYNGEEDGVHWGARAPIAETEELWWTPKDPEQVTLWESWVQLSDPVYRGMVDSPVPIDLRALKALQSSLAIDLYCWLGYRMSYLKRETEIPWEALELQFGAGYAQTRQFRYECLRRLKQVIRLYPELRISEGNRGLVLRPSPPHVPRLS